MAPRGLLTDQLPILILTIVMGRTLLHIEDRPHLHLLRNHQNKCKHGVLMNKLDILNRDAFVEQLLRLMDNISSNKASTCFAINGAWGCGKSFVLDMLEEQLNVIQSEETYTDRYFVIRYNSWKFDYYEEPLVAIVSTMIAAIEEKTKLFPDSQEKREILGMLKATGVALLSIANDAVKEKTGLDFQKAYGIVKSGEKEGAAAYESEHDYDVYFGFNKMIAKLAELLEGISKDYTIVFIVDELDRCAPEYAVKVLERLHHLTENQSNIVTIIAIDKAQLVASVKQLFGFENPEKYLEKFINFEIKLDNGSVSEQIIEKYADYVALFDKDLFQFQDSVEECLQSIFKDIDVRTQEQIVKKSTIAHKLLFTEKKDYSFMCMELLTAVMICQYKYQGLFDNTSFDGSSFDRIFTLKRRGDLPAFAESFKEKFEMINFRRGHSFPDETPKYALPNTPSLYGAIIFTWCWMHSKRSVAFQHTTGDVYSPVSDNCKELLKFAEMINLMQ